MRKKIILFVSIILLFFTVYFSYDLILNFKYQQDIKSDGNKIKTQFPIIMETHWDLNKNKENDISIFSSKMNRSTEEKKVINLLLKTYYIYDSFDSIEYKITEKTQDSSSTSYIYLNKDRNTFYAQKSTDTVNDNTNYIELFESNTYQLSDLNQKKTYVSNDKVNNSKDFIELFFSARIAENILVPEVFSVILGSALSGNAQILSNRPDEIEIEGTITSEESHFFSGQYKLYIDNTYGIIKRLTIANNEGEYIYQSNCSVLSINEEMKEKKLDVITDYTNVTDITEIN